MRRRATSAIVLSCTTLVLGCDAGKQLYPIADAPMPGATAVQVKETPKKTTSKPGAPDPKKVAECARGTGRNPTGACEPLRTRDAKYVQQVQLPTGTFVMGDIPQRYDAEKIRTENASRWSGQPPRLTKVDAFWLDLHEVTREAYAACVDAGNCTPAKCANPEEDASNLYSDEALARVPQTCVTREQAASFCASHQGRLPTEAEWEFAARGPDARIFPWGNEILDEYRNALMPVTGMVDTSYFGLRGLGSNALEWVSDPFALDVGLAPYLGGPFRSDGAFSKLYAAKEPAGVVKGGKAGFRRERAEGDGMLGFRCAADVADDVVALVLPEAPASIPLVARGEALQIFGGVAEGVTKAEAATFCDALEVPWSGEVLSDWRLPTLEEVGTAESVFRGPGPFWVAEGAAKQPRGGNNVWEAVDEPDGAPLGARCVRTPS